MPDNQDMFAPEEIDEYLERSVVMHATDDSSGRVAHELHALYHRERASNEQALQRVWQRLEAEHARRQDGYHGTMPTEGRLYALPSREQSVPASAKRKHTWRSKHQPNPVVSVLAALLFLVIMIGSLLAIVHVINAPSGALPVATSTPTVSQSTPTLPPDYAYPTPGITASISQPSPSGFAALTWSQDSKQVAASTQGKVWIWNALTNGQPLIFDPHAGNAAVVLAWSPGAPRLAVGSNQVQLIDPGNGVVISHYPALSSDAAYDGAARVTALAWSPDGNRLAVATHDPTSGNTVRIWDVNTGLLVLTYTSQRQGAAISSLSWSSDGRYIASANGQSVKAWDATHGVVLWQRTITAVTNVAWSPSATNAGDLAFADGDRTEVWNIWANTLVSSVPNTAGGVLAWSPDGHDLASASGSTVVIWDVYSGAPLYTYTGHTHPVAALAWSQDGHYLASGEQTVRVWSA